MKSIVLGQSILVAVERFNSLMAQLPRVGAALVELELIEEGRRVLLPVSKRAFKAFDMGDGTVLLSPQGDFQLLWAIALGRRVLGAQDRRRLGKNLRRLEVLGVQGPGVTLPGLRFTQGPDPKEFRGPARKFLRAAKRNGILGHIYVAEVGVPVHMLDRLGSRFGLSGSQLAAAARLGDVLLILRRMPLTDPITGFVLAVPVPVNSPGVGDVLYLHPDISLVLYGDQDGDRYYIDVAAVDLKGEYNSVKAVRPAALFPYRLQLDQITTQIKMSGLNGAPALAGVLAAAGVGPLFHIVFRLSAAMKLAGYRSESLEVLSLLTRVLEPLFDARKRAAEARVVGEDEGEPVMGYSLPYLKAIVQALKSNRLHQAASILSGLAVDLLSDKDEDAKAVGELVARAVEIMNQLPNISLEPSSYPELADVDVMAFGSSEYLLDGELVKPSRKPTINDQQSRSGKSEAAMMRELELPAWCRLSDRELAHSVGGSEMELPLVWEGENLDGAVQSALSGIYRELLVASAPEFQQVPPQNERERARFEEGEFWFIDSPESLAESRLDWAESNVQAPEEDGLVEDIGDKRIVLSPVYLEDGEVVRVYAFPIKDDGEVVSVDLSGKLEPDQFLNSKRLFHIGLGSVEKEGVTWYRFHLLALVAEKVAGTTYSGKSFVARRYRIVSLYASPWFNADPEALVSGMKVMNSFADRVEWLPGRIDTVADVSASSIRVRNRYITPQASLVLALVSGAVWRALGVSGKPGVLVSMLRGEAVHPFGIEEALRVQRDVRAVVRRLASQALELRNEYSIDTAKHIIVFGDLIRAGMVYAGSDPDPDIAIHRFNKLVTSVAKKMFGSGVRWYPRKGGQNRLIIMDIGDADHWLDMLAFGAQEWYRFVRETPALKAVPSSVNGKESIVQDLTVAFVEAPGFIQPAEGSSETAFLSASSVDWVEKEVSQLIPMPADGDYSELVRAKLAELAQFGFTHLRGVDGGLVPIENVDDFDKCGVAHRIYEHSVTSDHIERSVQFWAVARTRPAGAKMVLLDGMVKSFAGVVDGEITTPVGKVDAVFSYISLRKKQAWGLVLNGLARIQGKPDLIDRIWSAYRDKINDGSSEQEAMLQAFAVAHEAGIKFETVPVYVDGKRVGDALVVRVKGVFVDDVSVRDEDPDEAGFNGTVLFAAELVGVPYQRRFIDCRRAVEVSQALFGMLGKLDLPVLDPDPGPDAPDGDGKVRELDLVEDQQDQADQTDIVDLGELGELLKGELEDEMAAYAALASTEEVGDATLVGLSDLSSVLSDLNGEEQEDDDPDDDPDGEPGDDDPDDDPDAGGSALVLVVGTREPTDSMVDACVDLVKRMVNLGCTVVSGGADGIDTIAVSTAVAEGGEAKVILPWSRHYSVEGAGSCQVFVQELSSSYAQQKRDLVMSLHPAPHRLSDSVIKLHMRNVEMIDMIREAGGVVYAIPSWLDGEYSGGTGMAIRLCEYYSVPCFVYHPDRGWYKHV